MNLKHLPEAPPGIEPSKSNMAVARVGSTTLKITPVFKCTFKTWWSFHLREKHFAALATIIVKTLDRQRHRADLWQMPLQLCLEVCPGQSQTVVWGKGCF